MLGGLVGRHSQSVVPAANADLTTACDRSRSKEVRAAAWERYEVDCWYRAFKERGLLVRNMDNDRVGIDGESMQLLVTRRLKLPELSGSQTA